jgi:SAM-dependent methyltransferase
MKDREMGWDEGYVADVEYPAGCFPEQSPAWLNFACVLNGVEPIALDQPFTYFELGSGRGLTANLLAASNPQGRFYAADFAPSMVAGARQLASTAQLENLTLLESSFAELADGIVADLPQFDFITMHGVYSWVSSENRRHIVRFIARYLKPGGIVYVSYNAMPGWAPALPLQRLILQHADLYPGRSDVQVAQAREFVNALKQTGAGYFASNPSLRIRLDALENEKLNYLAHEYMNRDWTALYHVDVARDMAAAKLDYIGSADLQLTFPDGYLTAEMQALLSSVPDSALRETVRDYLLNVPFRKDVFVRGARRMAPARKMDWLRQIGLALVVTRPTFTLDPDIAFCKLRDKQENYLRIADALTQSPQTLGELAALPALKGVTMASLAELGAMLVASRQVAVCFVSSAKMDSGPAHRMNRAVALHSRYDDHYQWLASPLIGNVIVTGLVQRLVYLSLSEQPDRLDAAAITKEVWEIMQAQELESGPESIAELARTVEAILERRIPIFRQLKVL